MGKNAITATDTKNSLALLKWAERIIQQTHYETLDTLVPRPIGDEVTAIRPGDVTCMFRVTELVFSRSEGSLEHFTTVLNSLHACGASCIMLLQCQNGRSELYLGAVNKQRYANSNYMNTIREILRSGIEGNLAGTEINEIVSRQEIDLKLEQCLNNGFDSQCITAISCVPGDSEGKAEGIENLLEAVGNKNFTIMVLADPIDKTMMKEIRQGYENLATQLSTDSEISFSVQSGKSTTVSENYSKSFTETVSKSISLTQSHTSGTGWSRGTSRSESEHGIKQIGAKAASIGTALLSENPFFAMSAVSSLFGNPAQDSVNESVNGSESDTKGTQVTDGTNLAEGTTEARGIAQAATEGYTVQTSTKNRHSIELLNRVEWYLQWLNRCENYGMFNCCAYVISSSASINLMVASQYQALMQGKCEMNQPIAINSWTRENGVDIVKNSLIHMMHPIMQISDLSEGLSPAMLLSSRELSRQMALPQRSVVGISVMEYASFGREVVRKTPLRSGKLVRIGTISHMGKTIKNQPVLLDLQSMAAHTFVAGTNGSGKSNTVFRLLEELMKASIPFMVIEPAKGEYKNVFGHDAGVKVYGTNRKKSEILRINPFWFNEDVDVLEHIDKLIEVFNASWPMYAAMPAVLKAAIENAYITCGWNLADSTCRGRYRVFPTVKDVLAEFNKKMDSTAFSEEVKGNYVGALSTRMESLCNGIYKEIFGGGNLSDKELFDSNVIVDLSRVGSAETKSMIMGMLVIRLQEYRMSSEAMNLPLKHITVLEEAHHLLRKTSFAQSEDGSNMLGKSVEMISNSIAEMRSYGEGFIIVDQSPGLLDMSVMRNTNTKIILRLPESGDRDLVGNTMGLTKEQIYELSRMKTGVCAIYQKDWLEAVSCQIDRASHEEKIYSHKACDNTEILLRTKLVRGLLSPFFSDGTSEISTEELEQAVLKCGISGTQKQSILKELSADKPNLY
ncbi:MAG: helicase HerA domain-containing protein, partial [Eubacterium sp.]